MTYAYSDLGAPHWAGNERDHRSWVAAILTALPPLFHPLSDTAVTYAYPDIWALS